MDVPNSRENAKWYVTLFGSVHATNHKDENECVDNFRTSKCASLFAYLVYKKPFHLKGKDLRERIAYDIWENIDLNLDVITRRLTTELNWLRDTFGRDVFPPHSKDIVCDFLEGGNLIARAFSTDAGYWINTQVPEARRSQDLVLLRDTVINYGGQFAPGLSEVWAECERTKLESVFTEILVKLANLLWQSDDLRHREECLVLLEASKIKFAQGSDCHQVFLETYLRVHQQNSDTTAKLRAIAVVKDIRASRYPLSDELYEIVCELGATREAIDFMSVYEGT